MAIHRKRVRQTYDANSQIPESLNRHLFESIQALSSSPKNDYLKEQVFSKFVSDQTDPSVVRRQRAINKWLATERDNEATNDRLLTLHDGYQILPRVSWSSFRDTVCSFIEDTIGDCPVWEDLLGGFSGGATTSRKRTSSHPAEKYLGIADVTPACRELAQEIISESALWQELRGDVKLREVKGNVLFTVPKTTEIDRCACKEPDLNMYIQRGLGNQIRAGLRRKGINLNDQKVNKRLAHLGSLTGSLATLDLSSASDSISRELVFQLVPPVWFSYLDMSRSHVTIIDGEVHVNEMFSSMGNGFTFELESLLFYCISRAVAYHTNTRGIISVYGDDIIVPSDMFSDLSWVLGVLGFSVNTKKSFNEGPFRESCGGHYWNGLDITPFYVKAPMRRIVDLIHVCNSIRRWAENASCILDPEIEPLWRSLAKHVPSQFWGGHDTSFKGRLVSSFRPRNARRLMPRTRRVSLDEGGRYLLWLDNGRCREGSMTESVIEKLETSFKYRAAKTQSHHDGELEHYFYHEVMAE